MDPLIKKNTNTLHIQNNTYLKMDDDGIFNLHCLVKFALKFRNSHHPLKIYMNSMKLRKLLNEEVNSFGAAGLTKVFYVKHTVPAQSKAIVCGDGTLLILTCQHWNCVQSQVNIKACCNLQDDIHTHCAF